MELWVWAVILTGSSKGCYDPPCSLMWEVTSVHTELFEGSWSLTSSELVGRPMPAGQWTGEKEAAGGRLKDKLSFKSAGVGVGARSRDYR